MTYFPEDNRIIDFAAVLNLTSASSSDFQILR